MDHISMFTRSTFPIMFAHDTCKLDDKMPCQHRFATLCKINNIERTTILNLRINSAHVIYIILCIMQQLIDER
jgi:hypothetical protein